MELLKVSMGLTGKMEGMYVITSAMTTNKNCQKLSKCKGTICEHCFSKQTLGYRKLVRTCYEKNGEILSRGLIPENQLPFVNSIYCRFESHGDLHNITHLENFIRIAEHNPHCNFALWTKRYDLILEYFKTHRQPENMNIVISSLMLNQQIDLTPFEKIGLDVKCFTVYDKNEASKVDINCGDKHCLNCLACYRKNSGVKQIRERIK